MLLTFPVTLKAKSGERTPDKTSDSGNDSDLEEIYCAQDLANIYEERLKIPQDKILKIIYDRFLLPNAQDIIVTVRLLGRLSMVRSNLKKIFFPIHVKSIGPYYEQKPQ